MISLYVQLIKYSQFIEATDDDNDGALHSIDRRKKEIIKQTHERMKTKSDEIITSINSFRIFRTFSAMVPTIPYKIRRRS